VIAFMYNSLLPVNVNISWLTPKSREKILYSIYAYRSGAYPEFLIGGGGGERRADPEALYNLCLILKTL